MAKQDNVNIQDVIKAEYKNSAADPIHFIRKYCTIQHPTKGKIPFHLYEFQQRAIKEIRAHRYNIIGKGRQLGMSTVLAAYALWKMIFTDDYKILIIATTQDTAKELLSKIQLMYNELPTWIKSTARQDLNNKLVLQFSNGSSVTAVSSSPKSVRSKAVSLLIIDEMAFITESEEIYTAAQATTAEGGDICLLSTANGAQGKFYEIWTDAIEGRSDPGTDPFNPIMLPWSVHPGRDQKWADGEKAKLGARKFAQEHACLGGESIVTVRDDDTGLIFEISLENLYTNVSAVEIKYKENVKYSILSGTEFKKFSGIQKKSVKWYYVIVLSNGKTLKCTIDHQFIVNGKSTCIENIHVGDIIDGNPIGLSIISKKYVRDSLDVYDIVEVSDGNIFNVDGILSHNCDFLVSGHTVIEGEVLQKYIDNYIKEPIEKRYAGDFWIWVRPNYSRNYVLVADVSRGDGMDYSAFHIYDVDTMEHCASFKSKIDTRDFAYLIMSAATEWNKALLVVENHSVGWDVIQECLNAKYPNLYYSFRNDPFFDPNIQLRKNYDLQDKKDMTPGFTSSTKVRMNLISKLEMYFTDPNTPLDMKCLRTINELKTFMWINGKPQANKGGHDDLVMALCMLLFVRDTALRMRSMGVELTKRTVGNIHRGVYTNQGRSNNNSMWNLNTGKDNEDISWITDRKK